MIENVRGIILSSKDFREKDKLVTIFTVEKGKIIGILKGVKNSNAKLKYAKELFTFGEFRIIFNKDWAQVIGCEVIENFKNIITDPEKYLEGSYIASVARFAVLFDEVNIELFFEIANALKTLDQNNLKHNLVACKFAMNVLKAFGYNLSLEKCVSCGLGFFGPKYFIVDTGELVCAACKMLYNIPVSDELHQDLILISKTPYNKLKKIEKKLNSIEESINFLNLNINHRLNTEIKVY